MQTLLDDYKQVTSTNIEYQRNRDRWVFLLNSYVGGDEYRKAGYLTKYQLETASDYKIRSDNTPLDNHCQSVIGTYLSFLFRDKPGRELGYMEYDQDVEDFLKDADMEGRSLDHFMKEVAQWSLCFGMTWIIMTKPNLGLQTAGEEDELGVRPWVNLLSPLSVLDWTWERTPTGRYKLVYFKYIEEIVDKTTTVREWTPEIIRTWTMNDEMKEATLISEEINGLGEIPVILNYAQRSPVRGIGVSLINDISDIQRLIFNLTSECEQAHRLDGHPSLCVTSDTQYGSGAGSIIVMPNSMDPGLKPYVLEHGSANIQSLHATIKTLIDSIDRLAHTGGVRGVETKTLSGVAMEVEMSLLNARLAEVADNLELTEENLWKLFCRYQGKDCDVEIEYPGNFNIRDTEREFRQLQVAKSAATDPRVLQVIDHEIIELLGEDADLIMPEFVATEAATLPPKPLFEAHEMYNPETGDEVIARTEEEHLAYSDQGYIHREEY